MEFKGETRADDDGFIAARVPELAGKTIEYTFKLKQTRLSDQQRKYFFAAVVRPLTKHINGLALDLDLPPEDMILGQVLAHTTEETIYKLLLAECAEKDSIRFMTKDDFSTFMDNCFLFCAEKFHLTIEEPKGSENHDLNFDR